MPRGVLKVLNGPPKTSKIFQMPATHPVVQGLVCCMRLSFGPFILDSVRGTLTRDGRLVSANHKGIALLTVLLRTPGEVVAKTALMDAAWPGTTVEESQ